MIEGLQTYSEYKESGVPWLGKLPAHWRSPRIKTVMRELDARTHDGKGTLLSLSRTRGLIARTEMTDKAPSARSLVGYKLYAPGQVVMNRMQAWGGMFGAGPTPGLVSPDYAVFKIVGNDDTKLLLARLKSPDIVAQFAVASKGIGSGFNRLYSDKLGAIPISLPPPDEQAAIVRFLEHANRKIDGFIRAKRKLIGLLNEQKQAIIYRAVTRGLNPHAPLKPSGIPWLGDIPKHWETIRCGKLFREVVDVGHPEALLLSIDRFKGIIPQSDTGRKTRASKDRRAYKLVRRGQLAYNLMNAFMGALGFSEHDGIVSPAYAVARPLRDIETRFFHYLLRTPAYVGEYNRLSYGIMYERNRLYFERFKLVRALVPPLNEQSKIADWIEVETRSLNTAIARTEREIALMQEYRTRLTADVVTGKLDVRPAAAKLPEAVGDSVAEELVEGLSEEPEPEEG